MLLSTSSRSTEFSQWLFQHCEDVLSSCYDRAYVSRERVIRALYTLLYIHKLKCEESESRGCVEMIGRICNSVSQYILQLICKVTGVFDLLLCSYRVLYIIILLVW